MATKKETTPVTTNPAKLEWPTDYNAICQKLQREGCRSIGRMGGSDVKFDIVMETLRILAGHAKSKLADQKATAIAASEALIVTTAAREAVSAEALNRQERALEGQIAGLGHRLDGLKARRK